MSQKRAYQEQLRGQKIIFYKRKIVDMIMQVNANLFGFDYSQELEDLKKKNPADKALILQAEREAYKELKEK